jgi:mannose-6-phosphate isomerase
MRRELQEPPKSRGAGASVVDYRASTRDRVPHLMTDLYPLLMTPLFDPRPWGTHDLSPIYPRLFSETIGESWLTGDHCKVQNGALAGKSLAELAAQYKRELVGEAPADENRFPLLAKFLFPQEKLSVQVHPDDAAARDIGEPCGKTECWYVAHAKPGSQLALGLKPGVTREQFEQSVHENRAEDLLNWITVSAGDMIYVAGGTVHTLGPGSIIVETQQQSDTTFRLYDYGRPRELHLKQGLSVIKEKTASGKVKAQPVSKLGNNGNEIQTLIASPCFGVEKCELHAAQVFETFASQAASSVSAKELSNVATGKTGVTSVQILVAIDGAAELRVAGCDPINFGKGDAVVVPAAIEQFTIEPRGEVKFLKSYVPGIAVAEPETI